MKKIHKMIGLLFIVSLIFTSLSFASTVANSNTKSKFKDVSTSHWAFSPNKEGVSLAFAW